MKSGSKRLFKSKRSKREVKAYILESIRAGLQLDLSKFIERAIAEEQETPEPLPRYVVVDRSKRVSTKEDLGAVVHKENQESEHHEAEPNPELLPLRYARAYIPRRVVQAYGNGLVATHLYKIGAMQHTTTHADGVVVQSAPPTEYQKTLLSYGAGMRVGSKAEMDFKTSYHFREHHAQQNTSPQFFGMYNNYIPSMRFTFATQNMSSNHRYQPSGFAQMMYPA
ncbi:hypothetical protein HZB01_00095 [Candidatus Woesearchaeota archaeon]|nr:hypothetical protein [Candidatus Woesearchaeota archaeon]